MKKIVMLFIILTVNLTMFMPVNAIVLHAASVEMAKEVTEEKTEFQRPQVRGFVGVVIYLILKGLLKLFGATIATIIGRVVYNVGARKACGRFNDSGRAWDYFCDSANQYRD